MDTVLLPRGNGQVASLPEQRPDLDTKLAQLRSSIQKTHKTVEAERKSQAQRYRKRQHYERAVNFSIGDYVLRSRVDEKLHANKLWITLVGPFKVVAATDYYFTVEPLVTGKTANEHPSRLKYYADSTLNVTTELIDHISSEGTLLAVDALVEHRFNTTSKAYEVKVKWQGLEEIEDSWQPLKNFSEDVPQLLQNYVAQANDDDLRLAVTRTIDSKRSRGRTRRVEPITP